MNDLAQNDQSFFSQKKILVTGGAGFIGSHVCDALLAAGARVLAVDNFITGQKKNIEHLSSNSSFQFTEGDVTQPPETYLPADFIPDLVFHFASPASPPRYQAKPIETYVVNSLGTHYLLQFLLKKNPDARFLFASTSEVYGDPEIHPQVESYWGNVNPNGKRSCYDESKRMGETICGVHQRDFHINVRIVRIFNTYGPRMDLEDGRIIPNFLKRALNHQPLTIYGDGSQTRSYCYVSDLVAGILKLMQTENGNGETVNLGNPGEYTILETAKIIQQFFADDAEVQKLVFQPLPADDPKRRRPDISKAQRLLGWSPTIDFRTGLQKTIEFFRS